MGEKKSKKTGYDKSYRVMAKEKAAARFKPVKYSISEMAKIIERYNRKHGTCYTYGQFCEKLNRGEITI